MPKKINTKAKGNKKELEVKKIHEAKGYTVEKVKKTKYDHSDFFHCADLICSSKRHIKLIAVTDKGHKSRAVKALRGFKTHPKSLVKEAWLYPYSDRRNIIWEVVNV